jgi:hypothetical protein
VADDQSLPTNAGAASRQWLDAQIPALVQTTLLDERYADFWELWLAANRSLGRDDSHDESMIRAMHAVMALIVGENGRILDETFAADVTITIQFTVEQFPAFQEKLVELSHGSLTAEIIETNEKTIMPLATCQ